MEHQFPFNVTTSLQASFMKHALLCMAAAICLIGCASKGWNGYQGKPFQDSEYRGGRQRIPGRVQCAYYDLGGEGVAYHDSDATNHGSGGLNPANGQYLNEFRMHEGVDRGGPLILDHR
jgi:hypothetical protein